MDALLVVTYEVYVLSKEGWTLHARFPGDEQKEALTEAKAAEARLAAATKVIRSEYNPKGNEEVRKELYSSRMTPAEATTRMPAPPKPEAPPRPPAPKAAAAPAPAPAKGPPSRPAARKPHRAQRRREREVYTPLSAVGHLLFIIASAGLIAALITMTAGAIFGEALPFIGHIDTDRRRTLLSGLFVVTFLLMAVPWIIAFATRVRDIDFGNDSDLPKARAKSAPRAASAEPHDIVGNPASGEAPPEPEPEVLAETPEKPEPAAEAEPEPAATEPAATEPAATAAEEVDLPEGRRRAEVMRRSLMRFLGGLVTGLQQTRPELDAYERFGLGLLITGAASALAEGGGVDANAHRRLLREALGVLGTEATAEVLLEEIAGQAKEQRGQHMINAGRAAVLQFLRGGRDYMAAILAALEHWNRPSGATGAGVVAALVAEAWPFDDDVETAARREAKAAGGAVLGVADGIVILFPGAARAVQAALALMPALPAASRIGIDAVEAADEDEAVRSVAAARVACQSGKPGQILVTGVVHGLCSRLPVTFAAADPGADGAPLFAVEAVTPAEPAPAAPEAVPTSGVE